MNVPIKNQQGETLDYTWHDAGANARLVVILGHGVTGNKDRAFLVTLAERLSNSGCHVLRFSFAGNGDSQGSFEDCTISKEVDDLGAVFDVLPVALPIVYIGHSMGAAVGVLRAQADPRIRVLVSLAGMVHTADFAQREFGTVKPGAGFMWENESCPLSPAYMDDLAQIGSVLEAAAKLTIPWLLVHGKEDDVVPMTDAEDAVSANPEWAELRILDEADHVFSDQATEAMVREVEAWLKDKGTALA